MIAPARAAAYRALRLVAEADLGEALRRARDPLTDSRDRALATELVTGTLRWRGAIDYQLARLSGRPLRRLDSAVVDVLRLGAYQLLYLERLPASAVVNDSVSLVRMARIKSAAPFVNAVLRRLSRERGALEWPSRERLIEHLSIVHSHPEWLVTRWVGRYGVADAEAWLRFNNTAASLTLAANRRRTTRDELMSKLSAEGVRVEPTAIAPHGVRVLHGRALATETFSGGYCVVQDEASQLIPEVVAASRGARVLDACAAPGGKTIALAAQTGATGSVVATDVRTGRMLVLRQTLARCRTTNVHAVQISASGELPFRAGAFDAVLIDAPCSGLGTVRRDPDIKWKRTADDLTRFADAQVQLVRRVMPLVRAGGRLVYSTCSSEPEENEAVVQRSIAAGGLVVRRLQDALDVPQVVRARATPDGYLRTDPARDGLEAFFAAVLTRVGQIGHV